MTDLRDFTDKLAATIAESDGFLGSDGWARMSPGGRDEYRCLARDIIAAFPQILDEPDPGTPETVTYRPDELDADKLKHLKAGDVVQIEWKSGAIVRGPLEQLDDLGTALGVLEHCVRRTGDTPGAMFRIGAVESLTVPAPPALEDGWWAMEWSDGARGAGRVHDGQAYGSTGYLLDGAKPVRRLGDLTDDDRRDLIRAD